MVRVVVVYYDPIVFYSSYKLNMSPIVFFQWSVCLEVSFPLKLLS